MKIVCIGGGPAGLYFSLLRKKRHPDDEIRVIERNQPGDTFGWGVVFSAATLEIFRERDAQSFHAIRQSFVYWDDIETHFGGETITSTGHGFCGLSRQRLLSLLEARARELGVTVEHGLEVESEEPYLGADLIVGCDGANSKLRARHGLHFQPTLDWRRCRFTWLGTSLPLSAFTFHFKQNEHGLFQVHAYPFERSLSTWIVECREEVWRRAGLERASEAETVAYCERLFAPELAGHKLLSNRSLWRAFPNIACRAWVKDKLVLIGDAAHTAHFSIGSGTKLAMEDAMALVDALETHAGEPIPAVLAAYENARRPEVLRLQRAAQTSLEWFENSARYLSQPPVQFAFNLMTRSKRITYDSLRERDARLVEGLDEWFGVQAGSTRTRAGRMPPPAFAPFELRGLSLSNRIVVSPMCQYSALDGAPGDWHLVHLGSRAVGGAGLVMTEMTNVSAEGRITPQCTGMYAEAHVEGWKRIVEFVHDHSGARIGLQLAHAGRKGSCSHPWEGFDVPLGEGAWTTLAPSALPFAPEWPAPRAMGRADMLRVQDEFVRAARMAERAGFDLLELHMAHGYLLSTFLSPLTNVRDDEYGGSLERRMRFPLEVFAAVRAVWPEHKPMSVRLTATDWVEEGGMRVEDAVGVARELKRAGCDLIDVSSSGNTISSKPVYGRMFQVPFAEQIRSEARVPTMAVGAIQGIDHANTVIGAGRADLCALARPHLADPYLTIREGARYGLEQPPWPGQYFLGRPSPPAPRS